MICAFLHLPSGLTKLVSRKQILLAPEMISLDAQNFTFLGSWDCFRTTEEEELKKVYQMLSEKRVRGAYFKLIKNEEVDDYWEITKLLTAHLHDSSQKVQLFPWPRYW